MTKVELKIRKEVIKEYEQIHEEERVKYEQILSSQDMRISELLKILHNTKHEIQYAKI